MAILRPKLNFKPTLICKRCREDKGRSHFELVSSYHENYRYCKPCLKAIAEIRKLEDDAKLRNEQNINVQYNVRTNDYSQYFMLDGYLGAEYNYKPFIVLILGRSQFREIYIKQEMAKQDLLHYNICSMSKWEFDEVRDDVPLIYLSKVGYKNRKQLKLAITDYFLNYVK